MVKRLFDVLAAVTSLVLAIPVLAIVAMLIKLDSKGPVIFRQARMGRGFRTFKMFKLRTMRPGLQGSLYTLGADPRITRIGFWLRRSKIDELPQLWNVLRGEMSMVGPRPVVPELAAEFESGYRRLLVGRPGLTDPATLKYRREVEMLSRIPEPLEYFKTVVTPDKIRISQAYLQQASVCSDLKIILHTAFVVFVAMWRRSPIARAHIGKAKAPIVPIVSHRSA